jgi:preprotein translocase subunit SecB
MKIQLTATRVEKLIIESNLTIEEDIFNLKFANGFSNENEQNFIVQFEIELHSPRGYTIALTYIAEFESEDKITDEHHDSPFFSVNAPAIAYPYLRSFISFITLNSGFDTAILPTVNFQAIANEKNKSNQQEYAQLIPAQ